MMLSCEPHTCLHKKVKSLNLQSRKALKKKSMLCIKCNRGMTWNDPNMCINMYNVPLPLYEHSNDFRADES